MGNKLHHNSKKSNCFSVEKPKITTRDLALYLAGTLGETITSQKGDVFRVGRGDKPGKEGSISVHYNANGTATATDYAGDSKERDLYAWIGELEGIKGFNMQLKRAYEVLNIPYPNPTREPTAAFRVPRPLDTPKQTRLPLDLHTDLLNLLKAGLHTEEFGEILRQRGINGLNLDDLDGVGFMPSNTSRLVKNPNPDGKDIELKPRSLVVWDSTQIKLIPLDANGYRESKDNSRRRISQIGDISPVFKPLDLSKPIYLVEGEFDALALISIGLQAIPCKPIEGNKAFIQGISNPVLAYDWDDTGKKFTKAALRMRANMPSISHVFSIHPNTTDPNDFVKYEQNAAYFIAIETARTTEQAEREQAERVEQPEQPKRELNPIEKARLMTDGWMYDDYWEDFRDPDGKRWTLDEAMALFSRKDIKIRPNTAAAELNSMVKNNPARHIDGLTDRICQLASEYTDADKGNIDRYCQRCGFDAYETRRIHLWLYQICGRAIKRGEQTDCMLVLAGRAEGTRKTSFFNGISYSIMGDALAYYVFDNSKDSDLLLSRKPVVLVDELDQVFKKVDVATLKGKITQPGSYIRAPYDRSAKNRSNCAVFGATTNEEYPIPTGENEARRYWVVTPKKPLTFLDDSEPEGMMREAAYLTLKELELHKSEFQKTSKVGKLWVQTDEEERETAARNQTKKAQDANSIAIAAGLVSMERHKSKEKQDNDLYSAKRWATALETGDGSLVGCPDAQWRAPKSSASAITRLITTRCKRICTTQKGVSVAGYSFSQIKAAFCFDDADTPETNNIDQIRMDTNYNPFVVGKQSQDVGEDLRNLFDPNKPYTEHLPFGLVSIPQDDEIPY